MRRIVLWSMFMVCCVLLAGAATAAETVEEIIQKNLEVRGGEEAWLAVETARMNGTMRMGGSAAGAVEAPFTVEYKRPDKIRVEFTLQGMTGVQAFDGETGWMVMPFMGKTEPEEMAEDQIEQLKDQAEFEGPFVNYEEKGHTVELLGTEEVDGTPAFKIKLTKANGDVDVVYLDQEYFVEFKMESTREVQGTEVEVATVLGDYKEVDGLLFPHSMEMSFGGMPAAQVITLNTIDLGVEIPDERFEMPATTGAEAPADTE